MAKVSPSEFIQQVRAETSKVVWPTRRETGQTTLFVVVLTVALAAFFFLTDAVLSRIVQFLLSLI